METWIKLYRKFIEWEWFNISEMVHLYIYMLLKANNEEGTWRGITIKRGQLLTGLKSLNEATGISVRKIRTCLDRLHKTGEIDIQTTNKYSIITINKYDSYQMHRQTIDKQSDKQSTGNRQTTDNKQEDKEEKNNKEDIIPADKKINYAPFVLMAPIEYDKLRKEHGDRNAKVFIDILNNYKGSNGKKYKSDYLAILNWVIDRAKKDGKYVQPSQYQYLNEFTT